MLAECEICNNQLYYQQKMVVLSSKPLQFKILKFVYNSPIAGHPGHAKMYKIVQ
jgi:hypothetical protein